MDINETVLYIVAAFALGFALYNMGASSLRVRTPQGQQEQLYP